MPRLVPKSFNNGDVVRININQFNIGFPEETTFRVIDTDTYDPDVIIESKDGIQYRIDSPRRNLLHGT